MIHSIHVTDVLQFRRCRQAWYWSSHMQRNLEKKGPVIPFFVGKGIHTAQQEMYDKGVSAVDAFQEYCDAELAKLGGLGGMWDEEAQRLIEAIDLAKGMLLHYELWQKYDKLPNADRNLRFVALEHHAVTPLIVGEGGEVTHEQDSRWDGVVQRVADGTYWLLETKTTRSLEERKKLLLTDPQPVLYLAQAQKVLGITITGVLYNLLRKKLPVVPEPLKTSINLMGVIVRQFSQNKAMDTTYEYYRATLDREADRALAMHLEPALGHYPDAEEKAAESYQGMLKGLRKALYDHHMEMLERLWEKGNTFFERYEHYIPQAKVQQVMEWFKHSAREMTDPNLVIFPAGGEIHCNYCQFRAPCGVLHNGGDPDVLLAQEYQQRTPWEEPEVEGFNG